MDFAMTDEQELLLESVREFCDRYFTEDVIKEMYETGDMPDEIAEAYRDAGFGLMGIPEEYGGIPCDKVTLGMMIEELYHSSGCNHIPVSYTHLDVYKRQLRYPRRDQESVGERS